MQVEDNVVDICTVVSDVTTNGLIGVVVEGRNDLAGD